MVVSNAFVGAKLEALLVSNTASSSISASASPVQVGLLCKLSSAPARRTPLIRRYSGTFRCEATPDALVQAEKADSTNAASASSLSALEQLKTSAADSMHFFLFLLSLSHHIGMWCINWFQNLRLPKCLPVFNYFRVSGVIEVIMLVNVNRIWCYSWINYLCWVVLHLPSRKVCGAQSLSKWISRIECAFCVNIQILWGWSLTSNFLFIWCANFANFCGTSNKERMNFLWDWGSNWSKWIFAHVCVCQFLLIDIISNYYELDSLQYWS